MLVHDAAGWLSSAVRAARLGADAAALARRLAAQDRTQLLGADPAVRPVHAQVGALVDGVVAALHRYGADLAAHSGDIERGSRAIQAADGVHDVVKGAQPRSRFVWRTLEPQADSSIPPPPAVVAELGAHHWPCADVDRLTHMAAALASDAQTLTDAGADLRRHDPGHGASADAMVAATDALFRRPGGALAEATARMLQLAEAFRAYADAASATRDDMSTIAARVDLDRARALVLARLGGEPAAVEPASAGHLALAASAHEYRTRVEEIGRRADQSGSSGSPGSPPGVGAFVGGVGGAMAGAGAAVIRRRALESGADVDPVLIRRRAARLAQCLPAHLDVRMSVGVARTDTGEQVFVVGSSDLHDYLRPGISLDADETFSGCGVAPELTLIELCTQLRARLVAVASTRPPPELIADDLRSRGVQVLG